jgi:SPP1 gp7 family putative phage head morphogenesis protein
MPNPPSLPPRNVLDRPKTGTSANETLVDLYMERAIDLLRLEAGTRDKVLAFLHTLEADIVALLAKIDPNGIGQVAAQRKRLEKLNAEVTGSIRATYRRSDTLLAAEIREVIDIESTWTASAINSSIHVEFADAGLTRQQLETLSSNVLIQGAPSKEWWGRQAQGLSDRFADEMRRGVALGETNDKLVERVRGTRTTKGLMDLAETSAERLVRASVQTAANVGREATYEKNADLIASVDWSSTLDTRTTEWCMVRDGLRYTPIDHKPIDHDVPWLEGPGRIHWGCRSTSVPRLKTWRELGIDMDEIPQTTRASMDGQLPAGMTFEQWLKKQSLERQNTVLGVGKADLWRSGKITFRDLLDQNGRPLTTEQLRAKASRK